MSNSGGKLGHMLFWKKQAESLDFQTGNLLSYESETLKEAFFNWNPPVARLVIDIDSFLVTGDDSDTDSD